MPPNTGALKPFEDLGRAILERWHKVDFDALQFQEIATTALRERPPSETASTKDVLRWVSSSAILMHQADLDATFGEPPITVFHCERFYIEVVFWVDATTEIHQHAMAGAFHVMEGSSVHSRYRFTPEHRYSDQLSLGKLEFLDAELLTKGAVRPIPPGAEFVHSLFHLERPSVSVVIRTPPQPRALPQLSYARPGIAFDPFTKTQATTKKLQVLDLLYKLGDPDFEHVARESVRDADAFLAFQLLVHLMRRLEPHERFITFLETIRPSHARLLDALAIHASEQRRESHIIGRRALAKGAEHRFFLALLLNLSTRSRVLAMVRAAFPDREPVDTVVSWIRELSKLDAIHAWVADTAKVGHPTSDRRVLDFTVDDATLVVLQHLLQGDSDEAVVGKLQGRAAPHEANTARAEMLRRCADLRTSLLLRPLLVG